MSENTDYETLKAERDSALNTCSLIAEALGIKSAVAGDTIARVQQLVAEGTVMLKLLTDISENHSEFVDEEEDCMCASIPLDYVSEINAYVSRDVNAENPFIATDKAINGLEARGIDKWIASRNGQWNGTTKEAEKFAACLRGGE
jgi:hypothetical protein